MGPEKDIVEFWLNRKGFYTIKDIPDGKNTIDFIAKGKEVWHVEIVSSIINADKKEIKKRFSRAEKKVRQYSSNYKKVLIIGRTASFSIPGIEVIRLEDVLDEAFRKIDTHNYMNNTLRTLQIIKYIMLSEPNNLAGLMDEGGILNINTRESFLKELTEQEETKRVLAKDSFEPALINIIRNSTLNRPEKLAEVLESRVLGKKSRKRFIEALLKQQEMKKDIKESIKKDQKTLDYFIR
ncbi:MAG: hypothetical protein ACQEP1_00410 [Nanobdellota archaeon]